MMGKFPSYRIKNTIMRTFAKGVYCLTANALGAGVRQDAHFFAYTHEGKTAFLRQTGNKKNDAGHDVKTKMEKERD